MNRRRFLLLLPALVASCGRNIEQMHSSELVLLTTTTTQDSGILDALTSTFETLHGYRVKAIVAGSGDVLKQGARGEGDVVLSHSPDSEKTWMDASNGTSRRLVMYNDFVFMGPAEDPARIAGQTAIEALRRIAAAQALFVSRGDQSGTHVRELALWKKVGLDPTGQQWYQQTGQGQGLTMDVASQKRGYALTDRGTFLVHQQRLNLRLLAENDPGLFNIYHVMPVNPAKFPKVNARGGQAFADFLISPAGQRVIEDFGRERFGRSLFVPAAGRTEEELLSP
jgi:tungstate transport system substrate-binding protein